MAADVFINQSTLLSMRKLFLLLAAFISLIGCASKKNNEINAKSHKNCLCVYYSQNGATAKVAQEIASQLGIDTLRIDVVEPYGGSFEETIARCQKDMANGIVPQLSKMEKDIAAYDTIFLGYPIWFGTYAPPVSSLIKTGLLANKVIVPFCTFGSGGLEASINQLKRELPEATVMNGYGVRNARVDKAPAEITRFLIEEGFVDGEITAMPEFSQQEPVDDSTKGIFNAACGDYPMPIGTPVTVGKRVVGETTEYLFIVYTPSPDSSKHHQASVYITVVNDTKPEFTKVVR